MVTRNQEPLKSVTVPLKRKFSQRVETSESLRPKEPNHPFAVSRTQLTREPFLAPLKEDQVGMMVPGMLPAPPPLPRVQMHSNTFAPEIANICRS